ncbi:MAG: hypothetical protein WBG50_11380 [Desulfomonilaceae bacterium]
MNVDLISILVITVVVMCSFGYLADMIFANWRAMGRTKADPFSKLNKRGLIHRQKPALDCFGTCMKKYAWDVDETSLCASKCKA